MVDAAAVRSWLPSPSQLTPLLISQDYLVVGSDSGRLSLLELVHYGGGSHGSNEANKGYYRLRCVAWLPLGPSGCRRGVPGQYVAADPKGRAVFTGE